MMAQMQEGGEREWGSTRKVKIAVTCDVGFLFSHPTSHGNNRRPLFGGRPAWKKVLVYLDSTDFKYLFRIFFRKKEK